MCCAMNKIICALFVLVGLETYSQVPSIIWEKSFGGSASDSPVFSDCLIKTSDNGYIISGYSESFDGDITGNDGDEARDIWVVKTNSTGDIQWQKTFGGGGQQNSYSIIQTSDGGYVLAGSTNFDEVTGDYGLTDFWVIKINSLGILQWQKSFGGSADEEAYNIKQTTDGGYIVVGYTASVGSGDVTTNNGGFDFWVVKLNSLGNLQWQKCLGGTGFDVANSVSLTSDGGYIVAGSTESNDNDVTGNHGDRDCWVVKLNSLGVIQWKKTYGGTLKDYAHSIIQTSDSGYVLAGGSRSNNGDVTGNHGSDDVWIVKINATGTIQWQKALGGTDRDNANSIKQTIDGGYLIGGTAKSTNGNVTGNHGNFDCWIVKISSTGALQWQKSLGGSNDDQAFCTLETSSGEYIMVGNTYSNNGNITENNGDSDFWLVKLSSNSLDTASFDTNKVSIYPNPASNFIYIKSNNDDIKYFEYSIIDLTGRTILNDYIVNNEISIETLSSGNYILQLKSEQGIITTTKFTKK